MKYYFQKIWWYIKVIFNSPDVYYGEPPIRTNNER